VEAPRPSGPEPGAGADPLSFPAEAAPLTGSPLPPVEGARPQVAPLAFPAAATPLANPPLFPAETPAAPPSSAPLPFPVAELPGVAAQPPLPAPEGTPEVPPEPTPEAAPAQPPAASWLFRFGPPVLTAFAALLAVGGLFLPLFQVVQELNFRQGFLDARLTVVQTVWGTRVEVSEQQGIERAGAPVGILVIVGIIVLAAAASSRPGRGLTRWLLSTGAVFMAGVVATIWMGRFDLEAMAGDETKLKVTTGPGMWLLIVAIVLAAGAAVLAHLPLRAAAGSPGWADPALAYADTPTPPSGVAITVLPPDEEPGNPGEPRLR
jgi:hypothetical protein